jgi:hypothetical protein
MPELPRVAHEGDAEGKRPPAASGDLKARIADELYAALERLNAAEELLSVVSSWRDTLEDREVLTLLRTTTPDGESCTGCGNVADRPSAHGAVVLDCLI